MFMPILLTTEKKEVIGSLSSDPQHLPSFIQTYLAAEDAKCQNSSLQCWCEAHRILADNEITYNKSFKAIYCHLKHRLSSRLWSWHHPSSKPATHTCGRDTRYLPTD